MLGHMRRHMGERLRGAMGPLKAASQIHHFTHLIHLYLTQNDGLQSEAANRPVPCKHKGTRGFPDNFGSNRIKAVAFRGSQVQILSAHAQPLARLFTDRSGRQNEEVAPEDSEELLLAQGILAALLACHESSVTDLARLSWTFSRASGTACRQPSRPCASRLHNRPQITRSRSRGSPGPAGSYGFPVLGCAPGL